MMRTLLVVTLVSLSLIYFVLMPASFNKPFNSFPSESFPITANKVVGAPNARKLIATFAAPPTRVSLRCKETMGTGASGEIRSTEPHQ